MQQRLHCFVFHAVVAQRQYLQQIGLNARQRDGRCRLKVDFSGTTKYGFDAAKDILVSPYAGVRYTQLNMGGYTEGTAAGVTSPLAYQAINAHTTTALAGMGTAYKLNPQTMIHASVGLEKDTNTKNASYSASNSNISGLTAVDLNATSMKTRRTASLAAYYDLGSNQRIGISGIYRQEAYRSAPTTSVFASYTVGL